MIRGKKAEARDVGEDACDIERCDLERRAIWCTNVAFAPADDRFTDDAHVLKCNAICDGDKMTMEEKKHGPDSAREYLASEFERARNALVDFESGASRMRESQKEFDETWGNIIKNAVRLYGKTAAREALIAMGRPEDVTKMY